MKRSAASTTQSHKPFINRFFRESVGSLEQMNCICKWCGAPLPCIIGQSSSQISHGICSPCAESMLLEIPELPLDV